MYVDKMLTDPQTPDTQELRYEALINIRLQQINRAIKISDINIKVKINNL